MAHPRRWKPATAKRKATQERPSGQGLWKGEMKLVQHGDSLIGDGLTEKSNSRHANCLSCMGIYRLHILYVMQSICLEKLCGASEGVGLWMHSIYCRECTQPGVEEGVCCWSDARVMLLWSEGICFNHHGQMLGLWSHGCHLN